MTTMPKRLTVLLLAAALCLGGLPAVRAEGAEPDSSVAALSSEEEALNGPEESALPEETDASSEAPAEADAADALTEETVLDAEEADAASSEPTSSAGEADAAGDTSAAETLTEETAGTEQVITGFGAFDANANSLTIALNDMPAEEELMAWMPETLEVQLDGSDDYTDLPVEWFCLGDEYGEENIYLFQYSPQWGDGYVLSEEIDLYTEAPYILVYVSAAAEESISTSETVSSDYGVEEQEIFDYLRGTLGYNTAAACGVLANIYAESGMQPNNMENCWETKLGYTDETYTAAVDSGQYTKFATDSVGYGLCQWTFWTLKKTMLSMAQSSGESIGSLDFQLSYLQETISANDSSCLYNGKTIHAYMKSKISNSAAGAYSAAKYWCEQYEKPGDTDTQAIKRGNSAKSSFWPIYKNYKKKYLTVTLSEDSVSYTGEEQEPSVAVKYGTTLLTAGTDYTVTYKNNINAGVASVVVTGKGTYSGSQTTESFTITTTAPVLKYAIAQNSGMQVRWQASPGATRYRLYRKDGTSWVKVGDTTDTQLIDTAATKAGSYTYTVRCIASTGKFVSSYDKTGLTVQRLATPSLAKVINCSSSVKVTWSAVSGAETYLVYRKTGSGSWEKMGSTTGLSYWDKTAKNGKSYTYTVRCISEDGKVYQSGFSKGLTIFRLSAPVLKSAKNVSGKKITATWTKNSAAGGYLIRYQTGSKTKTAKVSSAKTLKKTIKKLSRGKTYTISVRAYRKVSGTTYYSAWSNSIAVKVSK